MRTYAYRTAVVLALLLSVPAVARSQAQADTPRPTSSAPRCAPGARAASRCTPEEYLLEVLRREGLATALAKLDSIATADPEVRRLGHNYSHALGLAAYTPGVDIGTIFSICTPAFQSGCHHGVIQSYFADRGASTGVIGAEAVNSLCQSIRSDESKRWLLFQCIHGLGHGLMMVASNNLPRALGGCDLLADAWEREVCYGAAFMENIVSATTPHHAFGRPESTEGGAPGADGGHDHGANPTSAAAGAHSHAAEPAAPATSGHDHGAAAAQPADEPWVALKKEEPLYPCTVLPDRYSSACYLMQTSAIINLNAQDVGVAARACESAPARFLATCFQSLGRDISALTVQDNQRALRLCGTVPAEYLPSCHLGYAKNLVDQTARIEDGLRFCALLASVESKTVCYAGMGEQAWALSPGIERRQAICAGVEGAFVSACRKGAGLEQLPRPVSTPGSDDTPGPG